jgi:hypothetical protein
MLATGGSGDGGGGGPLCSTPRSDTTISPLRVYSEPRLRDARAAPSGCVVAVCRCARRHHPKRTTNAHESTTRVAHAADATFSRIFVVSSFVVSAT